MPDWDYANAVIERYDGKYLIAGSSRSQFGGDYDVYLLLVDSAGNLIWDKYIGQSPQQESAHSLIETSDSNYVIVGDVNSNPYLLKFDLYGNLIWDKEYTSSLAGGGYSVGQSLDDGYYFVRPGTPTTFFKTNAQGDTLWTKKYNFSICSSVIQTSDSGFVLVGNTNPTSINQEISLIKTNPTGDTLWTKSFGGNGFDEGAAIEQLSDKGLLVAGIVESGIIDDESETYIIRTNSDGDTLWIREYYLGFPRYIKRCSIGSGYVLSTVRYIPGWYPNTDKYYLLITKLDTNGNLEWSKQFDGYSSETGNNIAQTSDGGFLLTGHIEDFPNFTDIILIKLDSVGNFVLAINDISNPRNSQVLAYPNPATNEFNLVLSSVNEGKMVQVKIYNAMGQELKSFGEISGSQFKIYVDSFTGGFYCYELITSNNQKLMGKLIVNK